MADYSKFAFGVINRWVGVDLEQHGLMNRTVTLDGKAYPTIIPARETPEVSDSRIVDASNDRQTPYILYHVQNDEENSSVYKKCEAIVYYVYSPTASKTMSVLSCIQDLAARLDWSVSDLNHFNDTNLVNPSKFDSQFSFVKVTFEEITGPEPIKQEGGRYGGIVTIGYEYVLNDIIGEPGAIGQGRRA